MKGCQEPKSLSCTVVAHETTSKSPHQMAALASRLHPHWASNIAYSGIHCVMSPLVGLIMLGLAVESTEPAVWIGSVRMMHSSANPRCYCARCQSRSHLLETIWRGSSCRCFLVRSFAILRGLSRARCAPLRRISRVTCEILPIHLHVRPAIQERSPLDSARQEASRSHRLYAFRDKHPPCRFISTRSVARYAVGGCKTFG